MERKVIKVINSQDVMMGDIKIGQPLPSSQVQQIGPFILLHHAAPVYVAPGHSPMDIGPHPHRGFEPVSFVFQGHLGHQDSLGNDRVIGPGGVQWTTAGRGLVHSEVAPTSHFENGGYFEMIQLWINLPAALKMSVPKYQSASREEIPAYEKDGVRVNVISGEYAGIQGVIESITDIQALTVELKPDAKVSIPTSSERTVLLYQLNGETDVNGAKASDKQIVTFEESEGEINISAKKDTLILFLTGYPIDEPVVSHGPFVMNTTTEIMEAMKDYSSGKMGVMTSY